MDTRRGSPTGNPFRPFAELGTDTVPVDLVELVEVRSIVTSRSAQGLGAIVSTFALIAVLTVIVVLAIASSTGWSVLDPWSG